jgi:hypothetical protein
MPRRSVTFLLVLPLIIVVAGCGGSIVRGERLADVADTHGAAHALWVTRANRICAERATAMRKLAVPRTQAELITAAARIVSVENLEYSRLAALQAPVRDRGKVSAFLESLRRIPREIERVRGALALRHAPDLAGARAALAAARRAANAHARRLGLTCRH